MPKKKYQRKKMDSNEKGGLWDSLMVGTGIKKAKVSKLPEMQQLGTSEADFGTIYGERYKPQAEKMTRQADLVAGGAAAIGEEYEDIKRRSEMPVEQSEAFKKAAEAAGQRLATAKDAAVGAEAGASARAMAQGAMYGSGGGGSRERMAQAGARRAGQAQQALGAQSEQQMTALSAQDLASQQQRKYGLQDQRMTAAIQAQKGHQAGLTAQGSALQAWGSPMSMQMGNIAANTQMANQATLANWQAQNAATAAQGQAMGGLIGGILSDATAKIIEGEMEGALDAIREIDLYRYMYMQDTSAGEQPEGTRFGPLAQQVQQVIPEAVGQYNEDYLGIDKDQIIWTLFSAVKELDKKVQELEKGE